MLLEPDVALTDFALAIECAVFASFLPHRTSDRLTLGFLIFFAAIGIAALLGGITHGFLPDPRSLSQNVSWTATLIAIGAASCASWIIGAALVFLRRTANAVAVFAIALFAVYIAIVLFVSRSYTVAIAHYLPAALFLLVAFALAWRRRGERHLMAGIAGAALTLIAAGVQQAGIGLHPVYFNHNALYHLVQAIALALLFWSAREMLTADAVFCSPDGAKRNPGL